MLRIASRFGFMRMTGISQGSRFFSAKAARIVASNDISDVAFYLQNNDAADISIVSAGRDIIPFNANSQLRAEAQASGNLLNLGQLPLAGDIQINGPGTLGVFAGRNLDLGTGGTMRTARASGSSASATRGSEFCLLRAPDLIRRPGVGPVFGLASDALDVETFAREFIDGPDGARYLN
jgi:hypothetical protein